jgi:hypothetical protein
VTERLLDKDGGFTDAAAAIHVNNVAPTATLTNSGPVGPNRPVTVSFSNATDPSSADRAAGLHYSFALTAAGLAGSYTDASPTTTASYTFATAGAYAVWGRVLDKDGGATTYTTTVSVTAPALAVQGVQVNDGAAQRSMVTSLTVTFNSAVTLSAGAIEIRQGNTSFFPTDVTVSGSQVVIRFTGLGWVTAGSLADGRYTLVVHAGLVQGTLGSTLAADLTGSFFRLYGDVNGDGQVDSTDLAAFQAAYRSRQGMANYRWYLDYNADGWVDATDYYQFLRRSGTSI